MGSIESIFPGEQKPIRVQLSYDTPSGERRTVDARLTSDHAKSVGGQFVLIRNDSNEVLTEKAWTTGGYAIESKDQTVKILAECAILREPTDKPF